MRVAAMRTQPGAAQQTLQHGAVQTDAAPARPRILEDVYSGPQDSESLWMASAWHGDSGNQPKEQPASPAAATTEQPMVSDAPAESSRMQRLPAGSRISYWA